MLLLDTKLFLISIILICLSNGDDDHLSLRTRIYQNIFNDNYDKNILPKPDKAEAIIVRYEAIPKFVEMDEEANAMILSTWDRFAWNDTRLRWDPKQYHNITSLAIDVNAVWKPDLFVHEDLYRSSKEPRGVFLSYNGLVNWVRPMTYKIPCLMDFTYWPWDIQVCNFKISSWGHYGSDVRLDTFSGKNATVIRTRWMDGAGRGEGNTKAVWKILQANEFRYQLGIIKKTSGNVYYYMLSRYQLQRQSTLDQKIAVLPLIICSFLLLSSFWLSPLSKTRIYLILLLTILMFLYLLRIRSILPLNGGPIPLVVVFCGSLITMLAVNIAYTFSMSNMVLRKEVPPGFVNSLLGEGILGKILCISNVPIIGQISYTVDVEALKMESEATNTTPQNTDDKNASVILQGWMMLAQALDRLFFVIYFIIIIALIGTYFGGISPSTL